MRRAPQLAMPLRKKSPGHGTRIVGIGTCQVQQSRADVCDIHLSFR
jgi:hypothetical protein